MRWLWGLPLLPLLVCGGMCVGGAIVAFLVGRKSAGTAEAGRDTAADEHQDVS